MTYYVFLKSLRSLEEFRKNPHVKIPPKSPSTNFQSLGKFKNPILFEKNFFLRIRPTRPSLTRAGPLRTAGRRACALGPSRPARPWRICQKSPLFLVCAARRRHLLPLSLPRGPRLSASSSPPRRPSRSTPPPRLTAIDRPVPPGLHHCDANQSPLLPRLDFPSRSPINTLPGHQRRRP
jgi:hypothetical protein